MNRHQLARSLIEQCLQRLKDLLAQDEPGSKVTGEAKTALRMLELAIGLEAEASRIDEREAGDIATYLAIDPGTSPQTTRSELVRRLRAREIPVDGPAAVRLHDLLLRGVVGRLRQINPRYITSRQRRAESSY